MRFLEALQSREKKGYGGKRGAASSFPWTCWHVAQSLQSLHTLPHTEREPIPLGFNRTLLNSVTVLSRIAALLKLKSRIQATLY